MTRRTFIAAAGGALASRASGASAPKPVLCIFSKHMPGLGYDQLARAARDIGFAGIDLTVRPRGHVLPERVAADLPRAVEAIRSHGLAVPMITTDLKSTDDAAAVPTLTTAGRLRIPFWKPGYWRYSASEAPERTVERLKPIAAALVSLGRENGVAAGLHNHSGDYVGSAVWDYRELLQPLDSKWAGYYFDPAHAAIEGGLYGHELKLRLALERLKMVAVKDFYWAKEQGRWSLRWAPLGQGMVDWQRFFQTLARAGFSGPISLHLEYPGGEERDAIARDFAFLKRAVDQAYAHA
jgi:sugar phosphate isomerase/epimerase